MRVNSLPRVSCSEMACRVPARARLADATAMEVLTGYSRAMSLSAATASAVCAKKVSASAAT